MVCSQVFSVIACDLTFSGCECSITRQYVAQLHSARMWHRSSSSDSRPGTSEALHPCPPNLCFEGH